MPPSKIVKADGGNQFIEMFGTQQSERRAPWSTNRARLAPLSSIFFEKLLNGEHPWLFFERPQNFRTDYGPGNALNTELINYENVAYLTYLYPNQIGMVHSGPD